MTWPHYHVASLMAGACMAFTIEPGLYVQPGDMEAPAAFRDIGIRIEDDVVITIRRC